MQTKINQLQLDTRSLSLEKRKRIHRWSLVIGNLLEHFDSSLYGFLAPVLGKVFFPSFSPLYQIILAYSVYLITFVARPFGGIYFSKLTYRFGPLKVLSWSLIGVALSTGIMGLLPDAGQIGLAAPLFLIMTRFFQSFCAAGESTIAGYYLIENTDEKKHLSWSGLYQSSTVIGILLASSISGAVLLSEESSQYWRYPFVIGFFLGLWALWLRIHYREGTLSMDSSFSLSYKEIYVKLGRNSKLIGSLIFIYGFSYLTYSVPFVFLNPYLHQTTSIPLDLLIQQITPLFWLDALLLPLIALLLNRLNWTYNLIGSLLLFTLSAIYLFICLPHHSPLMIFVLRLLLVMGGVGFSASLLPWTNRLFPDADKYLFHSISYNLGSELFGRSTPFICFWIYATVETPSSPLIYILGLGAMALGLILRLHNQSHHIRTCVF
jgi:nitrate/nitrite transporter NarK